MGNFFKGIGKGIFNILFIPVYIVGLALSAVLSIFVFFFELIKKIARFFAGKSLSTDLPEDVEAKRMIEEATHPKEAQEKVEVVQAEIAEPGATYKDFEAEVSSPKALPNTSNEEVDFLIDDSPLQIDVPLVPTVEEVKEEIPEEPQEYTPKKGEF